MALAEVGRAGGVREREGEREGERERERERRVGASATRAHVWSRLAVDWCCTVACDIE